jgi:cytochrome c biogenesis protein CcdA
MIGADNVTLGIVIAAALADSINPCVFGVLIFLLAFMTKMFKNRNQMLLGGLFYAAVVYVAYLGLGFGIIHVAVSLEIASLFYWIIAIIAILAGLLEIKDFFWYGKGFSLQMIPGGASRLKFYTKRIEQFQSKHPFAAYILIGLLGVFVVLVELPCTGAPYFAVLALLAAGDYSTAVPLLLLYNLVFILPLFFIIALAYFGKGQALERWRLKHRGIMRLGIGLFLIALGIYMINSVFPLF